MKKITEKLTLSLTLEEAVEYNNLVDRDALKQGLPTEDDTLNRCPRCGRNFNDTAYFCSLCGQRIKFVVADYIPL